MSAYGLPGFRAVRAVAIATPEPGFAALCARSLAHGVRCAPAYPEGFSAGDLTSQQALALKASRQRAISLPLPSCSQ